MGGKSQGREGCSMGPGKGRSVFGVGDVRVPGRSCGRGYPLLYPSGLEVTHFTGAIEHDFSFFSSFHSIDNFIVS